MNPRGTELRLGCEHKDAGKRPLATRRPQVCTGGFDAACASLTSVSVMTRPEEPKRCRFWRRLAGYCRISGSAAQGGPPPQEEDEEVRQEEVRQVEVRQEEVGRR